MPTTRLNDLYGYVSGSPLRFRDLLGLTQYDIDVAWQLVRETFSDLAPTAIPPMPDIPRSADVSGTYNPNTNLIRLNERFLDVLSDTRAEALIDTIIHELIHQQRREIAPDGNQDHDYVNPETRRRVRLVIDDYLRRRKSPLSQPYCP